MFGKCLAHGFMFDLCLAHVLHMFDIRFAYDLHMFDISLTYAWQMFFICQTYVWHMPGICMTYICLTYVVHMFDINMTCVWHMFCIHLTFVWHLPDMWCTYVFHMFYICFYMFLYDSHMFPYMFHICFSAGCLQLPYRVEARTPFASSGRSWARDAARLGQSSGCNWARLGPSLLGTPGPAAGHERDVRKNVKLEAR